MTLQVGGVPKAEVFALGNGKFLRGHCSKIQAARVTVQRPPFWTREMICGRGDLRTEATSHTHHGLASLTVLESRDEVMLAEIRGLGSCNEDALDSQKVRPCRL